MADEETTTTTTKERYLYLYTYEVHGELYTYWSYFDNRRQAEATVLFYNAGAPYIKGISLEECPCGVRWRGMHIPYKESEWKQMHNIQRF